jgi:hypothetical protein
MAIMASEKGRPVIMIPVIKGFLEAALSSKHRVVFPGRKCAGWPKGKGQRDTVVEL